MSKPVATRLALFLWILVLLGLAGCAAPPDHHLAPTVATLPPVPAAARASDGYVWLNRLTWGATPSLIEANGGRDLPAYLAQQLHPTGAALPAAIDGQIRAMAISQRPLVVLVRDLEKRRKDADAQTNDEARKAALQSYQQEMTGLARETATRHILRALYSSHQIQEQMTWFWMNHFSVFQYKGNIRAMLADYEDEAIRPRALGRFRDLLAAVVYHPAMLRYLDNERNGLGRINENFARELLELHTLGVDGGYSQSDVQEMARILTGAGVNLAPDNPPVRRELQPFYVRRGLFEFHPGRHDFGEKQLLGQPIRAKGLAEIDEALDRLARHPSTARFISRKLAQYWMADAPPAPLVERMSQTFVTTDGDIARTLYTLFTSAEFAAAAGHKFKDPMHYVISAVRLAYDDKPILNAGPIINWLNRMGEPLYGRQTPDGFPMTEPSWASPGQMATRFEVAKAIGSGNAGLFKTDGPQPQERAAFPQLANALYYQSISKTLSAGTRKALEQATSPQEWNTFLLSAPEMMSR